MAVRVDNSNFVQEVLESKIPVLVEFYTDSCIPCKQFSPILGEVEEEFEDRIKVVKVNVNFSQDLVEQYHVMAAPTTLLFKDAKEEERIKGLIKKDILIEKMEKLL